MKPFRWTIGRLMLVVAGCAVVFWISRIGQLFLVLAFGMLVPLWLGYATWRRTKGRPFRAGLVAAAVSLPAAAVATFFCLEPFRLIGVGPVWMVALGATPVLAACCLAGFHATETTRSRPRTIGYRIALGTLAALPLSIALTLWPLQLAFRLALPEMLRLVREVEAGRPVRFPRQVGFYTVVAVQFDPAHPDQFAVLLDTDPSGPTGFVHAPGWGYSRDHIKISPTDSEIDLGDGWRYMIED